MLAPVTTGPFSNPLPELLQSVAEWSNPIEMQILLVVSKAWSKMALEIINFRQNQEVQEIRDFAADVIKLCPKENKEWISDLQLVGNAVKQH